MRTDRSLMKSRCTAVAIASVAALFAACGSPPIRPMPPDMMPMAPDLTPTCTAGTARCGGDCVDLKTDAHHCGACGTTCASGRCAAGVCGPPDMTVIGQRDYTSIAGNAAGYPTAMTLAFPTSAVRIGNKVALADTGNSRVLIFDGALSGAPSTVLGQDTMTGGGPNFPDDLPTRSSLQYPTQLATDGNNLIVVDWSNNRVLIWNTVPLHNNAPADLVIGQADFDHAGPNRGLSAPTAATLSLASCGGGVAMIDGKLVIADSDNHRVLVWNSVPAKNGAPADLVIGQAGFGSMLPNRGGGVDANTMNEPGALGTDGTKLAVSDTYNHRILIFDAVPTKAGASADRILGQATSSTSSPGSTLANLNYPYGVVFAGSALYVADSSNHRLLYWSTYPSSNGAPATGVIGQGAAPAASENRGGAAAANSLSDPSAPFVDGSHLYVSDFSNNRVVDYSPLPTSTSDAASAVLGQASMTGNLRNRKDVDGFGLTAVSCAGVSKDHVVVGDRHNSRVLIYRRDDLVNPIAAVGQPDFTTNCSIKGNNKNLCPPASPTTFTSVNGCSVDEDGRLYVDDGGHNRVLVYDHIPTAFGTQPDFVVGQPNFTSSGADTTRTGLYYPSGIHASHGKLFIADQANARVLVYSLPITGNAPPAIRVLGQPDFTTNSPATTASKMASPQAPYYDGTRVFVGEGTPGRVLVWNNFPSTDGASADYVLGKASMTDATDATWPSSHVISSGNAASGLAVIDNFLWVPDRNFSRLLGYDLNNLAMGMPATRLIGEPDFDTFFFTSHTSPRTYSQRGAAFYDLDGPTHILLDPYENYVWISEGWASRVSRVRLDAFPKYFR